MSSKPTVISVINLKGGVGKTTVTALLARYAAKERGLDVLVVDMDPQANLSQALMTKNDYLSFMDNKELSIVELFKGFAPPTENQLSPGRLYPESVVKAVDFRWGKGKSGKLEVVPSRFDFSDQLTGAIRPSVDEKVLVLAQFITQHMQHKDLVLIDCAPTESILTIASYHASRYVLIPVKTEFFSTIGFPLMQKSLDEFRRRNPVHRIDVCGVLIHRTKTSGSRSSEDGYLSLKDIREQTAEYGWDVFENTMDHSDGYPKLARDPHASRLGNARYEWPLLAQEILDKTGIKKQKVDQ